MKLRNILIPLTAVAASATVIVPLTTACSGTRTHSRKRLPSGYIDGTKELDTTNFNKYTFPKSMEDIVKDGELPDYIASNIFGDSDAFYEGKATKPYIDAVKENPQIAQDDYASHLTDINWIINNIKDIAMPIPKANADKEFKIIKEVKVNAYGGKVSDLSLEDAIKVKTAEYGEINVYPASWKKSMVLSMDLTINLEDYLKEAMDFTLGWGDITVQVDLEANFGFTKVPAKVSVDFIKTIKKAVELKDLSSITQHVRSLAFGINDSVLFASNEAEDDAAYKAWEVTGNFDANIAVKSDYVTFNIGGGKKQDIVLTPERMKKVALTDLYIYAGIAMSVLGGWSTHYFTNFVIEQSDSE